VCIKCMAHSEVAQSYPHTLRLTIKATGLEPWGDDGMQLGWDFFSGPYDTQGVLS